MVIISFKEWTLTVNREVTQSTYASVTNGSAEDCLCMDCINYSSNRESVFPCEVKLLLEQLGIDYRKESEVWRMFKGDEGLHTYTGIFHYKGIFDGKDCIVPMGDGKSFTFTMTPINESFSIGFRVASDLSYFSDENGLVQLEYEVKIPWSIDKKSEPKE